MTRQRSSIGWPSLVAAGLAALLALAVFALPSGAQNSGEREGPGWLQSSQEIADLIEGRTHYRQRDDGTTEVEFHSLDGRVAYEFDGCIIPGRWWVEQNVLCYAYPTMSGGLAHCFWLRLNRGQLEYWSAAEPQEQEPLAVTIDNLTGNPEHLALDADGRCYEI